MRRLLPLGLLAACGEPADLTDVVSAMDGARLTVTCTDEVDEDGLCEGEGSYARAQIQGRPNTFYAVTFRLRGVVERTAYEDFDGQEGPWRKNGTPVDPDAVRFRYVTGEVDDLLDDFWMNATEEPTGDLETIDHTRILVVEGQTSVQLLSEVGDDGLMQANADEAGDPLTVRGLPSYDGQWLRLDVEAVTEVR